MVEKGPHPSGLKRADLAEHSAPARFLKYHYASIDPAYVN
jgi:hypothetical protein